MGTYFVQFSCTLDVGSAENAARAADILSEIETELDAREGHSVGFEMEPSATETSPGRLWIHGDEYGDPEHVIAFVLRCAEAFNLDGLWGFCWGLSCSRPYVDGFGGGAQLIDLSQRKSVAWIDCETWLAERLRLRASRLPGVPTLTEEAAS